MEPQTPEKKEKEAKAAVEEPAVAAVGERCEICGDGHSTVTCSSYDDIGLDSDVGSDEEIPEGYTRASLHYSTKANGERIRGPAVRVVPMVCFRCYKFGDHRPENCPGKVSVHDRTPRSQESRTSELEGAAAVTGKSTYSSRLEGTRHDTKDIIKGASTGFSLVRSSITS